MNENFQPASVIIVAVDHVLSVALAAKYLASSTVRVIYLVSRKDRVSPEKVKSLVCRSLEKALPGISSEACAQRVESQFQAVPFEHGSDAAEVVSSNSSNSRIWFLAGGCFPARRAARNDQTMSMLRAILSSVAGGGALDFNYAGTLLDVAGDDGVPLQRAAGDYAASQCESAGVPCRIFRTAMFLGEHGRTGSRDGHDFLRFLDIVHELKYEIHARAPEYFDFHSLRCWMPPGAMVNFIHLDKLVDVMISTAENQTVAGRFSLAGPQSMEFADLCDQVGAAYDLSVLVVDDRKSLNAIDLLMDRRLEWLRRFMLSFYEPPGGTEIQASPDLAVSEEEMEAVLREVREAQEAEAAAQSRRLEDLQASLQRRRIDVKGTELAYFTGGSDGAPIVIINAFGQGLRYWHRLIEKLMPRRRVIVWELRGLEGPSPMEIPDHADDLCEILRNENVDRCHLLAWCTGPKIAIEFYHRFPDVVSSMVFLNSSFRSMGYPDEMSTAYELGLERLCQVLAVNPELGASMVESLQEGMVNGAPDASAEGAGQEQAVEVLSRMNLDLTPYVRAPFRDTVTAVKYARQLLDFFTRDVRGRAREIRVPVLLVASELDKIASPVMSVAAIEMFPRSRCVRIHGGTHQCLYDRPDLICGLVEDFFDDPNGLRVEECEVDEIALGADLSTAVDGEIDVWKAVIH